MWLIYHCYTIPKSCDITLNIYRKNIKNDNHIIILLNCRTY